MILNEPSSKPFPQFGLRSMFWTVAALGVLSLIAKVVIEHESPYDQWAREEKRKAREFLVTNPAALDGWKLLEPGDTRSWSLQAWSNGTVSYADRNNDGAIDIKFLEESAVHSGMTYWEDKDSDGYFETEVFMGCFRHDSVPLPTLIRVPAIPETFSPNPE